MTTRNSMRSVNYSTSTEYLPGNYGKSLFLHFRDKKGKHKVELQANSNDHLYVFRQHETTFIISINFGLPYVGIEAIIDPPKKADISNSQLTWELFLQGSEKIEECLGKRGEHKSPWWIARVLSQYMEY